METYMIDRVEEMKDSGLITFDRQGCDKFMDYRGDVKGVINNLRRGFDKEGLNRDLSLYLNSNRLLSGVIDYGLRKKIDIIDLRDSVLDFCMDIYEGDYQSALSKLTEMGIGTNVLCSPVQESKDKISWAAFDPSVVRKLIGKLEGSGITIHNVVLDGHDAYRPGFMVATYFNSDVWPIRNAQDSGRDTKPRLLKEESGFLEEALTGSNVLIMGEDASTGTALNSLYELVISVSEPNKIITAAPIFIPGDRPKIPINFFGEERTSF